MKGFLPLAQLQLKQDRLLKKLDNYLIRDENFSQKHLKIEEENWKFIRKKVSSILINLTNKCNSECNLCFMKYFDFLDITIEDMSSILSKIGKNKKIILWGGEPTTRSDLPQVISLIKKSHNFPILYTNGLLLSNKEYVRSLKEAGLSSVLFSFDGFRPETYSELRGDSRQLDIKLKALSNMKELGLETHISMTISSGLNEDEMEDMVEFCVKNNDFIKAITFYPATSLGKFDINTKEFLTVSDLLDKISDFVVDFNEDYIMELNRFYPNAQKFLSKFGFKSSMRKFAPEMVFRVINGRLEPLIALDDLKEINESIVNGSVLTLLSHSFKQWKLVLNYLLSGINPVKFEMALMSENVLGILTKPIVVADHNNTTIPVTIMKTNDGLIKLAAE